MKSDDIDMICFAIVFIGGLLLGLFIGSQGKQQKMEREAILKGHAAWVTDAKGQAQFEWKK
jgi:hypothetical protein